MARTDDVSAVEDLVDKVESEEAEAVKPNADFVPDELEPAPNADAEASGDEDGDRTLSRRARAAQEREREKEALEARFKEYDDDRRQMTSTLQELREQNARMAGQLEAIKKPEPVEKVVDVDELYQQAREALDGDNADYGKHEKLLRQAIQEEAKQAARAAVPKQEDNGNGRQQPPQLPIHLQVEIAGHLQKHTRLASEKNWMQRVAAEENALAAMGLPEGPERRARAFSDAEARMGKPKPATQQFARSQGGHMSGESHVSHAQPTGGRDGSDLSALERDMAAKFKMDPKEYAKYK